MQWQQQKQSSGPSQAAASAGVSPGPPIVVRAPGAGEDHGTTGSRSCEQTPWPHKSAVVHASSRIASRRAAKRNRLERKITDSLTLSVRGMLAHDGGGAQARSAIIDPMTGPGSRARFAVSVTLAIASLTTALAVAGRTNPARQSPALSPQAISSAQAAIDGMLPVVAEFHYRITGKVRLLLFWVSRDGVGAARIRVRRGETGATGLDLLIGSDPKRAPRGINRWGYILEETRGDETTVVGLMKKSDEDTLDQAASNVAAEAKGGVVFKMIQATVTPVESVARVTTATVPRDYSYRELDTLVAALAAETAAPRIRKLPVPPGGRPGLLDSIEELIRDAGETVQRTGLTPGRKSFPYVYYSKRYEVARVSTSVEKGGTYGGVTYPRLLRANFEVRSPGETWTERFTIVSGIDGPLAGVPVFVHYQPRWWFAVEMVLDDREKF